MAESDFIDTTTYEIKYGVLYPDGRVDWNTASWFGAIDTPERRKAFAEQYRLQMESFGVHGVEVQFLSRSMQITCFAAQVIVDPEPEPEPEPEPTPEPPADPAPDVEPEPADPEQPAAPDEPIEPPTEDAQGEEELPAESDGPEGSEPEQPVTDDEGVPADGG